MQWDDVRHLLALARTGSVRGAGASLGVSHSTVARRIEALESELGTRLFDRGPSGYTLTVAGREMLPTAERVEQDMARLERGAVGRDSRLAGTVEITCCDAWVSDLLVRGFVPFCAAHPDIQLGMTTDSRPFDLSRREADVAVRILARGSTPPDHLIGTRLGPLVVCNYVATAHARRLDPAHAGAAPRWLSSDAGKVEQHLIGGSSYPDPPIWGAFRSLDLMVQAARAGLGLVMLPTYVGDAEPALRRLAQPDLRHVADLWLLSHPDLRTNARCKAARARIAAIFDDAQPLLRGDAWCADGPAGPGIAPGGSTPGNVG